MSSFVSHPAIGAGKASALALALASLFSIPAIAQTAADKALAPVVVTATRTPESAINVLSDNIIITAEDIAHSGQTSLVGLLQ